MKIVKTIFYTLFQIALFVLLPVAIFTLLTTKMPVLGIQSFVVLTGSMQPTLPVGSIIYTKPTREYVEGDIITFKNKSGETVTHRIAAIDTSHGLAYRTKGDANTVTDTDLVSAGNVIGKSFFSVPFIGRFINLLKQPLGFIGFIVIPTLLFVWFEIMNIKKEIGLHIEKKIQEATQHS